MKYIEQIVANSPKADLEQRWHRIIPIIKNAKLEPMVNIVLNSITGTCVILDGEHVFYQADKLPSKQKQELVEVIEAGYLGTYETEDRFMDYYETISTKTH